VVLAPVAGVKLAEVLRAQPGGQTINPLATVTRRIRRRGEREISRQTIAQGEPGVSGYLWSTVCSFLCTDCGCQGHPAFPAPSDFSWRKNFMQRPGRDASRECEGVFTVIASAAKQSISPRAKKEWIASLRSQ